MLSSSWQCTTSVSARSTGFELPHSEWLAPIINTLLLYKTRQNRQGTIIKVLFVYTLGSKLGKEIVRRNSVALCFLRSTVGPRRLMIVIVGKCMRDLRRKVCDARIQTQSRSRDGQEALNSAGFWRGLATVTEVTTTNAHAAIATTGAFSS